jgi:hypothetical protein
MLVEIDDEFGDDEAERDIAANPLGDLLRELREEIGRPEPIAEQLRDHDALRVIFVLGEGLRLEGLVVEIAGQDEGTILRHLIPGEPEEEVLGFEIADLQGAVSLGTEAGATAGERQLRFRQ